MLKNDPRLRTIRIVTWRDIGRYVREARKGDRRKDKMEKERCNERDILCGTIV